MDFLHRMWYNWRMVEFQADVEKQCAIHIETAHNLLPWKQVVKCFYLSFRFSQGDENLQRELFLLFRLFYGKQPIFSTSIKKAQAHFSNTVFQKIDDNGRSVEALLLGEKRQHVYTDSDGAAWEALQAEFFTVLEDGREQFNVIVHRPSAKHSYHSDRALVDKIFSQMIKRDYKFFFHENHKETGRPNRSGESNKIFIDPWFSYVRHFGLEGNKSGEPALDALFVNFKEWLEHCEDEEIIDKFEQVLVKYQEKHPESEEDPQHSKTLAN